MIEDIKRKKGIQSILIYLIVFYIVAAVIQIGMISILQIFHLDITSQNIQNVASSLMNFLTYLVLFISLIYILGKDIKAEFITFKENEKNKTMTILASFGIFYIISLFFQNLVLSIEESYNLGQKLMGMTDFINTTSDNQTVIEQMMKSAGAIPMFLSAVVLGPICEELVFRKAFFDIIKKPEIALIVSSLVFGSIHIFSSIGFYSALEIFLMTIPYVASGVALGYIYIRSKQNIWIPIIVHTLSNFISMIGIIGMMGA